MPAGGSECGCGPALNACPQPAVRLTIPRPEFAAFPAFNTDVELMP